MADTTHTDPITCACVRAEGPVAPCGPRCWHFNSMGDFLPCACCGQPAEYTPTPGMRPAPAPEPRPTRAELIALLREVTIFLSDWCASSPDADQSGQFNATIARMASALEQAAGKDWSKGR